jgi:hypothetical protein
MFTIFAFFGILDIILVLYFIRYNMVLDWDKSNQIHVADIINVWGVSLSKKNIVSDQLLDALYTKEEISLLNEWVSAHEISMLNKLFGKEYIVSESGNIINRLRQYNDLLKNIETHDKQAWWNPYKTIITTWWFLNEPYNKQRKYHWEGLHPNNKKIDNELLVDLFSQWYEDLLEFKEIDESILWSRKLDLIKERWNDYLFSPKNMIYVDVSNRDNEVVHERWINQLYVKNDGLRFVSLLPDNSTNYVVSWFDDYIIKSHTDLGNEYVKYLISEILRTTKKNWIVTWINFERNSLLWSIWMKDITPPKYGLFTNKEEKRSSSDFYCYEKE